MTQINKDSVIPLYHQLRELLRDQIENRTFKPHEQIPSEHTLEKQYKISRATVRKAIDSLVRDGFLYRLHGKGTFVAEPKDARKIGLESFTESMIAYGFRPHTEVLEQAVLQDVPLQILTKLGMEAGEKVVKIRRLRYTDDRPILIATSYLPWRFCPGLEEEDLTGSLYALLSSRHGLALDWGEDFIEPVLVNEEDARLLAVEPGSPALLIERFTYTADNDIVEFCESVIRGDQSKFYLKHIRSGWI